MQEKRDSIEISKYKRDLFGVHRSQILKNFREEQVVASLELGLQKRKSKMILTLICLFKSLAILKKTVEAKMFFLSHLNKQARVASWIMKKWRLR